MHKITFISNLLFIFIYHLLAVKSETQEHNCVLNHNENKDFWSLIQQQNEFFDGENDGILKQFLMNLEQEERKGLFTKHVIHPNEKDGEYILLEQLGYDFNVLKSAILGKDQCLVELSNIYSSIKDRLNLAIDHLAAQCGIGQIDPVKVLFGPNTIFKNLAMKWMPMNEEKSYKNEQKSDENSGKNQHKMKDLLELIRGLLSNDQIELLGMISSNKEIFFSGHGRGLTGRRRRKRLNGIVIAALIVLACAVLTIAIRMGLKRSGADGTAADEKTNENGNEHGPRLPSRRASRRENIQPTTRGGGGGGGGGGGRRERNHEEEEHQSESESQSDSETGSDKEDTEADEENQRPRRAGGRRVNPE